MNKVILVNVVTTGITAFLVGFIVIVATQSNPIMGSLIALGLLTVILS